MKVCWVLLLLVLCACVSSGRLARDLATGQVATDYDSYRLQRVGLVPFGGDELSIDQAQVMQSAFFSEVSRRKRFEVVPLERADLEEIPESEPYRRGVYKPQSVIDLSRRYNLDAVLVGTVTDFQSFPPLRLSVQVDMVASETGLVIWSSSVHLDARDQRVKNSIKTLYSDPREEGSSWEITLLSPSLFAQFAAYEISQLL